MTSAIARALVTASASLVLLTACGSQPRDTTGVGATSGATPGAVKTHTMGDGTPMSDAEMKTMGQSGKDHDKDHDKDQGKAEAASAPGTVTHRENGPSQPAGMICSREVAQAVQRVFALPTAPLATDGWADHNYTCDYRLPTSMLKLSVKDLDEAGAGRAYFNALGRELPGARPIRGLQNLGFPAVETSPRTGSVAFLKDHKTLWVDASKVAPADLPPGFGRTGVAYAVAAAVIACWTE